MGRAEMRCSKGGSSIRSTARTSPERHRNNESWFVRLPGSPWRDRTLAGFLSLAERIPFRLPVVQSAEFDCFVTVLVEELRSTGGSATAVSKKDEPHILRDVRHPACQLTERNMN